MSAFSDEYQAITKGMKIKVYEMAEYVDIIPATLYQILNGKRKPTSLELADRISSYLCLSPDEAKRLKEVCARTILGESLYWQRQFCQEFVNISLSELFPVDIINSPAVSAKFARIEKLSSYSQIQRALIVLGSNMPGDGTLTLCIPYDFPDLLFTMQLITENNPKMKITQIASMPRNLGDLQDIHDYFDDLKTVLSLYLGFDGYDSLSYSLDSKKALTPFPYYGLSSGGVVLISEDLKSGLFIQDASAAKAFQKELRDIQKYCSPHFIKSQSLLELCTYFSSLRETLTMPVQVYSRQLCFAPLMTYDLIEKVINPQVVQELDFNAFGSIENAVGFLSQYVAMQQKQWQEYGGAIYFSEVGIQDFLETGVMYEFPGYACLPLEPQDRIQVIKNLVRAADQIPYRMLRKSTGNAEDGFNVFVSGQKGYIQIRQKDGNVVILAIHNLKLISIFKDYFSSLSENDWYTKQEMVEILESMIARYQEIFHQQ